MKLLLIIFFSSIAFLYSQNDRLNGMVVDENDQPVEGAIVHWLIKADTTYSDESGFFSIAHHVNDTLKIEHLGFNSLKMVIDNIRIDRIVLMKSPISLPPTTVYGESTENKQILPGRHEQIKIDQVNGMSGDDITSLFKYSPDIQIIGNGTGGSLRKIIINGFGAQNIAFKMEDVSINSKQNGEFDLSLFNTEAVESVDVDYSGNSFDAGPFAMGGVINVSLLPVKYLTKSRVRFGLGSYENMSISAFQTVSIGESNGIKTGFTYRKGRDNYTYRNSGVLKQIYNSDFQRKSFFLGGRYKPEATSTLKFMLQYDDALSDLPSLTRFNLSEQGNKTTLSTLTYRKRFDFKSYLTFHLTGNFDDLYYKSVNLRINDHYLNDQIASSITYLHLSPENKLKIKSGIDFTYYRIRSSRIDFHDESDASIRVSGALRDKYGERFVFIYSGGVNAFYSKYDNRWRYSWKGGVKAILSSVDAYLSVLTGFKIPNFNDRYWPVVGDPDLKVETSKMLITGTIVHVIDELSLGANYTVYRSENMIRWIPLSTSLWKPRNALEIEGEIFTLRAHFALSWFDFNGGVSFQSVRSEGREIQYVPEMIGGFLVNINPVKNLTIFVGNKSSGQNPLVDGGLKNGLVLPEYSIYDTGIIYKYGYFTFSARVNNLTDVTYFLQKELPMKGINYAFSLEFLY